MKTISLRQPLAYLICSGIKDIENRTWKLPEKYKNERVLIHASVKPNISILDSSVVFSEWQWNYLKGFDMLLPFFQFKLATSAIIGSVEIVDCVINHPSIWAEKTMFDYGGICYKNKCEHFKRWSFGHGDCESCELVGQSYLVETIPDDCLFKKQMPKPIYNWVLANPILFDKPILNVKGKLSFWDYDLPEEYETILKI
mgnify:CR=1 FL=1